MLVQHHEHVDIAKFFTKTILRHGNKERINLIHHFLSKQLPNRIVIFPKPLQASQHIRTKTKKASLTKSMTSHLNACTSMEHFYQPFFFGWVDIAKKTKLKLKVLKSSLFLLIFTRFQIPPKFKKNHKIFIHVSSMQPRIYERMLQKCYFHIEIEAKIWLNLFMDYCHFGYITKLNPQKNTHIYPS